MTLPEHSDASSDIEEIKPTAPSNLGSSLPDGLKAKLHDALLEEPGQISSVYAAMCKFPTASPTELEPHTTCANAGAVGNLKLVIETATGDTFPTAASRIRSTSSAIRSLRKRSPDDDVTTWLSGLLAKLDDAISSSETVEKESEELEASSEKLAKDLMQATGVYVYTYPHYWRHPQKPDSERRFLKIGQTKNQAWSRIKSQARLTAMPEDPLLLRVYISESPADTESKFHALLDAAEHHRSSGTTAGREWFITTIEYCDAIAKALGMEILIGSSEVG